MTKDWIHGVGHSSVCQILLQVDMRAVITSSPPAWTSSAGMLSTPADFPFVSDCTAASTSLRRMGWSSSVALEDYEGTVSIGGRTITNLRFADDIDGLAGEEEELANFVERLDNASTAYGMNISAEKIKLMTNNTSGINTEIKVNGQTLETVTSFKFPGHSYN